MHKYLILQDPGHNRVYYLESQKLCEAELEIAGKRMETEVLNIHWTELADISYLAFETQDDLSDHDLDLVSRLSFVFAIFELSNIGEQPALYPRTKSKFEYLDPKISSLLRYQGKTNELFTRLMINIALLSSKFNFSDPVKLLDPVSGKGTTLFESGIHGFDAYGIDKEEKSIHEATVFFKKYLEREKLKHQSAKLKFAGKTKSSGVFKQEFEYAKSKDDFKDNSTKKLIMVSGNTTEASHYFKKNLFHLLVADLPYGIAHGSKSTAQDSSLSRNPLELLDVCLPEWYKLLKKDAVIVMAYNKFVTPTRHLYEVLQKHNFDVFADSPYQGFEHRVDQAIKRDIVVAIKKQGE